MDTLHFIPHLISHPPHSQDALKSSVFPREALYQALLVPVHADVGGMFLDVGEREPGLMQHKNGLALLRVRNLQ